MLENNSYMYHRFDGATPMFSGRDGVDVSACDNSLYVTLF